MDNAYALIMAGGAGTRLWPLSRQARPKPLIPLIDHRSMFRVAVDRLAPNFPPEHILVVANGDLTPELQREAPHLPPESFIIEPEGRDTAPAVGLGAIHVRHRNPDGVMAVLTADHFIHDEVVFRQALRTACQAASEGSSIVTLGITPSHPSIGFGYIERGPKVASTDGVELYEVVKFHEKPDPAAAEEYVDSGKFSWNSGMFIWPVRRVMAEFATHASDINADLERIAAAIGTPRYEEDLNAVWPTVRRTSVDFALMEHIRKNVLVIPVEMGWNDIGNFEALYDVLSAEEDTSNVMVSNTAPIALDTDGTLIFSDRKAGHRLVATIGLQDMVIIDTDDALLICRRDRAQDVRQIVHQLKQEQRDSYL